MEYTFENNVITVIKPSGENLVFIVDPSDPEPVYDRNNVLVGYTTLAEHKLLAQDFTDVSKLEYFVNLILTDPADAYQRYLQERLNF